MLLQYDFAVTQLRYIREAANLIASFRPDGQTPATLLTLIASANPVRGAYVTARTALDGGRADRRVSIETLHDACVDFAAQAANVFRKNPNVSQRLERLPVQDRSFQETLTRADAILALWAELPQVGTPPADFVVKQGTETLSEAAFQTLRDAAGATHEHIPEVDQIFQIKEADLHAKQREMGEVITASLTEGKSQFDDGTAEREVIDAIPTESPRNLPAKATISDSGSPATGVAHLAYDADGATSFDIYHRAPGEEEFGKYEEDRLEKTIDIISLDPGVHEFYLRGRNARGLGEESEIVSVDVLG